MKKTFLALGLIGCLQAPIHAQKSISSETPQHLFVEGKEMFLDKNYIGAKHRLIEYVKQATDDVWIVEAQYMLIAIAYYQQENNRLELIEDFLEKYPFTYHRQELAFWAGSCYFENSQWQQSLYWLKQSDINYLSLSQQQDYAFRLGYTQMKLNNLDESYDCFWPLSNTSSKYTQEATYYVAYIDFLQGRYTNAATSFERLSTTPQYQETAAFYLTMIDFVTNNENATIQRGELFLRDYPQSTYKAEVHRVLGNIYFKKGIIAKSVANYENYLSESDKRLPKQEEDNLFLGSAYVSLQNYAKAVPYLKKAASSSQESIAQQGYMQLGIAQEKQKDYANALLAFGAASKMTSNEVISERALYNYAMITYQSSISSFGESVEAFKQFLAKYPSSPYTKQINQGLASVLLSSKNYQHALSTIETIKQPDREVVRAKQIILLQLGIQSYLEEKNQIALDFLQKAIALGKIDTQAYHQALFWQGQSFYAIRNYSSAASSFGAFISQVSPSEDNATLAQYELGYAYFKLEQYTKANTAFLAYIAKEQNKNLPTYADALNRIADGFLFVRNYQQAQAYYTRAVNIAGAGADYAEFQKAFVMGLQHQYNQKINALDKFLVKYPHSQLQDDALYEKSRALVMLKRDKEAISSLETLLNRYGNSPLKPKATILLGQIYYNDNQEEKALSTYKIIAAESPNSEEGKVALLSIENIYKDANRVDEYAQFVRSLGGKVNLSTERQDSLTFAAAENIYIKGQRLQAKDALQKYLSHYPNGVQHNQAKIYLANIAKEENNTVEALGYFRQVAESSASSSLKEEALKNVANIEYTQGNYNQAYKDYQRLVNISHSSETQNMARVGLLRSATHLKYVQEVEQVATQLLSDSKVSESIKQEALLYRAKAYLQGGQESKAMADLEQCAINTRYVQGAEAQYIISEIYFKNSEYDKVINQVDEFMKNGTPHQYWLARAIITLSDAYVAKGDTFMAKQYLQSLQESYQNAENEIRQLINERLSKLD